MMISLVSTIIGICVTPILLQPKQSAFAGKTWAAGISEKLLQLSQVTTSM